LVFITHNLGIVAELCEYVIVMYAGKIVERAPVMDVFDSPAHPYTKALLDAAFGLQVLRKRRPIPGEPPNLANLPPGCSFNPRCVYADDRCRKEEPPEVTLAPARSAKCWYPVKA
jgi:oligopeptide/dipeptide ABC transporter ATP-binding protein